MPERLPSELWSVSVCSKAEVKVGWQGHRRESRESMAHRKAAHREVYLEEREGCCQDTCLVFSRMSDLCWI